MHLELNEDNIENVFAFALIIIGLILLLIFLKMRWYEFLMASIGLMAIIKGLKIIIGI